MWMFEAEKEESLFCLDTHTGAFRHPLRLPERESSLPVRFDGRSLSSIQQSVLRMAAAAMLDLRVGAHGAVRPLLGDALERPTSRACTCSAF